MSGLIYDRSAPLVVASVVLLSVGLVGVSAMLLIILLGKLHRHPTWFSFCGSLMVYCTSYLLLAMSLQEGPKATSPDNTVCVVQAVMTHATPTLVSWTGLACAIHLWFRVAFPNFKAESPLKKRRFDLAVVSAPYFVFFIVLLSGLSMSVAYPGEISISSSGTHCSMNYITGGVVSPAVSLVGLTLAFTFHVATCISFYHTYTIQIVYDLKKTFALRARLIRISVFSVFLIIPIGVGLVWAIKHSAKLNIPLWFGLTYGILPVMVVIVFGTTQDIITASMFWRPPKTVVEPLPDFVLQSKLRFYPHNFYSV